MFPRRLTVAAPTLALVAIAGCSSASAISSTASKPAAEETSEAPAAAPAAEQGSERTPANIRACRDFTLIKMDAGDQLDGAVSGGGYFMSPGATFILGGAAADAVSASPSGIIGANAHSIFDVVHSLREDTDHQIFIGSDDAAIVVKSLTAGGHECGTAGVTLDDVKAVPPLLPDVG